MADRKPNYDAGRDYGGELARHSEYKPGEQATFEDAAGHLQRGEVLHVSNGPGGQLYIIENSETGFPDVLLAREIIEGKNTKQRWVDRRNGDG